MKKILYLLLGLLSLGLGIIGAFLPVLPTTPLLLLALFCFSKSSKRLHTWLENSRFYREYLEEFMVHRSMSLKRKVILVSFASTMLAFPLFILEPLLMKLIIVCVYIYLYYYFIFRIKTT